MLIYNPAYDIYHTMFRILQLSSNINKSIEIDKLKILDFYYVFPTELLRIKKPVGFKKYDKFLVTEINKYDKITNPRRIFYKMNSIQYQAIKILVASGYLDSQNFEKGIIKFSTKEFPLNFKENIEKSNKENNKLITLLIETLADINLSGHLGLKERTGLIEFRYDTI